MQKVDTNLIIFDKLFQVPKILEAYQSCKKNNDKLPRHYYQMKLFELSSFKCLGLLLGINDKMQYVFLLLKISSSINAGESFLYEMPVYVNKATHKSEPLNLLWVMPVEALKREVIEENDYTIKYFLTHFNEKLFKKD